MYYTVLGAGWANQIMMCRKKPSDNKVCHSTEWLEIFYANTTGKRINLYSSCYRPIHDFMLIWNIFERDILGDTRDKKTRQVDYILNFADRQMPNADSIETFFAFVKKRYYDSAQERTTPEFSHLEISTNELKGDIENAFKANDEASLAQKNQVCLMIVWRYRNNLFHGNKMPTEIIEQIELFEKANDYLISYIESNN